MVVEKRTYYDLLGLKPGVSYLEIKRAYRKLVKSYHPDVDYQGLTARQRNLANEQMAKLNEAYETLKDKVKRAAYDSQIAAGRMRSAPLGKTFVVDPTDTEEAREEYLRQIFHPSRQRISKVLNKYKQELHTLSQDIYDERLVAAFEQYTDDIEDALIKGSQSLSSRHIPSSLQAAELMMRYAIAQAVDGLEELRRFCSNYDYDHLSMADNLFREAKDLSKKALQLTKQ